MIKPLNDRVLIQPDKFEEKTSGGIIIPETGREKQYKGTIISVGNGTKDDPIEVKIGDSVLYSRHAGTEVEYEGVKYLMMRQGEILAIL